MKQIIKSVETQSEDIALINKYTRRDMKEDEVFIFSVVLCDNEIDREGEAFTKESLQKLAELFLGKTGIFDHDPKGKNQTARIFSTSVEPTGEMTSFNEPRLALKARAYMVKSDRYKDLILEIDAGIIKEVSVGCRVEKKVCSICGAQYDGCCGHRHGEIYDGKICYSMLIDPTDAFEWSFVAVPAQTRAGIIKNYGFNKSQIEKQASIGRHYIEQLRAEVIKSAFLSGFMTKGNIFPNLVLKMNIEELEAFKDEFGKNKSSKTAKPQLLRVEKTKDINNEFLI